MNEGHFPPEGIIRFALLMYKMILGKLEGVERMVCRCVSGLRIWKIGVSNSERTNFAENWKSCLFIESVPAQGALFLPFRLFFPISIWQKYFIGNRKTHTMRGKKVFEMRGGRLIRSLAVSDIMASPRGRIDLVLFLAFRTTFAV